MNNDNNKIKIVPIASIRGRLFLLIMILAVLNPIGTLKAAASHHDTVQLNQSPLAGAAPGYPKADSPQRAIELWSAAYVQRDFETLVHYMHPEAWQDFKKQVISMSWQLGKAHKKKEFVSILKGVETLADMERLNPREIFFAFLKSLTLSPGFLEKLKQTKISIITHLQDNIDLFHFFLRVYPPIYANSSRLVTISVKSYQSQWRVLLSSWLEELVLIRLQDFTWLRDRYYAEKVHEQIEKLGNAAIDLLLVPLNFDDKRGVRDTADMILKNKYIFRLIILDNELKELFRLEKKEKPVRNWERDFTIQYKEQTFGKLILSYGIRNEEEVNFSSDSDVEALGALALEAILVPFQFSERESIHHILNILLKSDRIQKVWVQKGKEREWVSVGSGAGWDNSAIMAFEIDPGDKKNSPSVLFIRCAK
jgi:hypothetical protein